LPVALSLRDLGAESGYQPQEENMKTLTITRNEEKKFTVVSGPNTYTVAAHPKWSCNCPARGMCKHLRTVLTSFGMGIGQTITVGAMTNSANDANLARANGYDTIDDWIDLGRDPQEIRDEISAAKQGRAAYRRFLGY
jgi:hypothetical protein